MIPVSAVRESAAKAVRNRTRRWLADPTVAAADALAVSLKPPTEAVVAADPDAARDWARSWHGYSGPGVVDRKPIRWPSFGTQTVPVRLVLSGADEICQAADELMRWRRLLARRGRLLDVYSSPTFDDAVAGWHKKWDALDDADFDRLVAMLTWLLQNPQSGMLIRQLPVDGVHTKWLGAHRGLIEILVNAACGSSDLGVHTAPQLFEFAVLDRRLLPGLPRTFAASVAELDGLPIIPHTVLLVENRECLHALPDAPGTVALVGSGNAVVSLARIGWLQTAAVYYWGDIDNAGIVVVGRLRRLLPHVVSVMMDVPTFRRWERLTVAGSVVADNTDLPLTDDERDVLDVVITERKLLEQERIPWEWAYGKLLDTGVAFAVQGES